MPIWENPSDRFYEGPATYRLLIYGQNYCGKTFGFKKRMKNHKTHAKNWEKHLSEGSMRVQDVCRAIDNNWDDVVIEIIARYPNKRKGVEADELFMDEREIEGIALYNSYHNGLNMTPGGKLRSEEINRKTSESGKIAQNRPEVRAAKSQRMMGNQHSLGYRRTAEQKQAHSQLMRGHKFNADRRKSITATQDDKTWHFESSYAASTKLANEFKEKFDQGAISKACRGKYHGKHVYKGIHFIYD